MFAHGNKVVCIKSMDSNDNIIGKKGTVIGIVNGNNFVSNINKNRICVEFDEKINPGHSGLGIKDIFTNGKIKGKYGNCWYVFDDCIKLDNKNRRIMR